MCNVIKLNVTLLSIKFNRQFCSSGTDLPHSPPAVGRRAVYKRNLQFGCCDTDLCNNKLPSELMRKNACFMFNGDLCLLDPSKKPVKNINGVTCCDLSFNKSREKSLKIFLTSSMIIFPYFSF